MHQLTIRGFDEELAGRIRQLASRDRHLVESGRIEAADAGARVWESAMTGRKS